MLRIDDMTEYTMQPGDWKPILRCLIVYDLYTINNYKRDIFIEIIFIQNILTRPPQVIILPVSLGLTR